MSARSEAVEEWGLRDDFGVEIYEFRGDAVKHQVHYAGLGVRVELVSRRVTPWRSA